MEMVARKAAGEELNRAPHQFRFARPLLQWVKAYLHGS